MIVADVLVQQLLGGLSFGIIYSLVALGFTMIIRALDLVHFGHGEMLMLGGMVGFTLTTSVHVPYLLVIPIAFVLTGIAGGASGILIFRPLIRQGSPIINMMIATIGMSIALQNVGRLVWGSYSLPYPQVFRLNSYDVGGVLVPSYAPWVFVIGFVMMAILQWFFNATRTGVAMRAASVDPATAQLMGINPERMVLYTLAMSGALGGAAGVLVAPIVFATYNMGVAIGIKAFAAATIGGLGSLRGAMVGGLIVGLVETEGASLVSSAYKDAFPYALLILVLLVRPRGLLGGQRSGEIL